MSAPSLRKKKSFVLNSKPSVRMCREQLITMASPEVCWPLPMRAIGAQNLLTMPGGVSTSGYLHKKGGSQFSLLKWPLRYIIIHKGCVYYFKTSTSPSPQGAFSLNGYNRVMRAAEETTSSNVFPFKIIHFSKKHRTWYLSAASEEERRKWMRHLRREIDRYNDRRESLIPSDSDSDAESFYGSIERTMDIKHSVDNTEHDYMDEEDDEEEDYVKPDTDCSPMFTGRATVPPPAYPPPPVPSVSRHSLPPPLPSPNKTPPGLRPKNPPPSFPPPSVHRDPPLNKGPPPPPPNHIHPHKPPPPFTSPTPPLHLPPFNLKKPLQSRTSVAPGDGADRTDRRLALLSPATQLCDQSESRMILDSQSNSSDVSGMGGRGNTPGSNHHRAFSTHSNKSGVPLPPPPNSRGSNQRVTSPPLPGPPDSLAQTQPSVPRLPPPHLLPQLPKPGVLARPSAPKPPPPTAKPPSPPCKPGHRGPSNQRESPEGQSFRSSVDRPAGSKRGEPDKHSREDDDDQDYENVHLPESVFVDTTETSSVEKLFKDSCKITQDGLYCFRNSATKTSKVLVVWDMSVGKARNYRLFVEETRLFLDNELNFPSLSALVEHYHSHPLPNHGTLCLQHPYGYSQPR